ncbi:MAG: cytochrome c3 family protein [Desulfuromonas sp.]|nr:cytochrome c3 family protein [Desulfuromonas sp.]
MINRIWVILITLLLLCSNNVWATVSGQCSNCHTMHNSQNGTLDTTLSGDNVDNVNRSLTKGDCVGCHTGDIVDSIVDKIPYIMSTSGSEYGPDYADDGSLLNAAATNTLAGGTFNYVRDDATQDSYAHNVSNIRAGKDSNMTDFTPPGWEATTFEPATGGGSESVSAVADSWGTTQLTCAGTNGCHGNHTNPDDFGDIRGAHHGDDSTIDGSSVAKSFRFLRGILGQEDAEWELNVSTEAHNIYYGVDRTSTATPGDKQTISYLCAECHGMFHGSDATDDTGIIYDGPSVDNANPWLRHPTDFSLSTTGTDTEYLDYAKADADAANADGGTLYNYIAPLASSRKSSFNNDGSNGITISNPFATTGDDIVTCLSCHRAHGSKYPDLLRWDYTKMQASASGGFANKGCFACHTSKD